MQSCWRLGLQHMDLRGGGQNSVLIYTLGPITLQSPLTVSLVSAMWFGVCDHCWKCEASRGLKSACTIALNPLLVGLAHSHSSLLPWHHAWPRPWVMWETFGDDIPRPSQNLLTTSWSPEMWGSPAEVSRAQPNLAELPRAPESSEK